MRQLVILSVFLGGCVSAATTPGAGPAATTTTAGSGPAATDPADPADPVDAADPADDAAFVGSGYAIDPDDEDADGPSRAAATCDGAHDHCLPSNSVFAVDADDPGYAYVALPTDEGPWVFVRDDIMYGQAESWQTERATTATAVSGATVVYFDRGDRLPTSPADAVGGTWRTGRIASASGGTLRLDDGTGVQLGATRVVR